MTQPRRDEEPTSPPENSSAKSSQGQRAEPRVEPMEDEEKILAGRLDVNLPALLTKDSKGG